MIGLAAGQPAAHGGWRRPRAYLREAVWNRAPCAWRSRQTPRPLEDQDMIDTRPLRLLTSATSGPAFQARVTPYLLHAEAVHCLLLGGHSQSAGSDGFAVEHEGEIVAVAGVTPPRNLILSDVALPSAIPFLVAGIRARGIDLPGVIGPEPHAERFAATWREATGREVRRVMHQRVFQTQHISFPGSVAGSARAATPSDRPMLLAWVNRFAAESLPPEERAGFDAERMVENRFAPPAGWMLWCDAAGEPVSVAGYGGATPNGIRLGPVYTPPEHRRRGYGSAVTAAATRMLLDRGHRFVFLFTDLANPTSNHIYAEVGYQPVADFAVYRFTPTRAGQ